MCMSESCHCPKLNLDKIVPTATAHLGPGVLHNSVPKKWWQCDHLDADTLYCENIPSGTSAVHPPSLEPCVLQMPLLSFIFSSKHQQVPWSNQDKPIPLVSNMFFLEYISPALPFRNPSHVVSISQSKSCRVNLQTNKFDPFKSRGLLVLPQTLICRSDGGQWGLFAPALFSDPIGTVIVCRLLMPRRGMRPPCLRFLRRCHWCGEGRGRSCSLARRVLSGSRCPWQHILDKGIWVGRLLLCNFGLHCQHDLSQGCRIIRGRAFKP